MHNFLSVFWSSSCLLNIYRTSMVPLSVITQNSILSKPTNALICLSSTLSTIFIACSSNFTPLYAPQFITSSFPSKIGTTTLIFHLFRMPPPSNIFLQSFTITPMPTLSLSAIISVLAFKGPAAYSGFIPLVASTISIRVTFLTGPSIA